MAGARGVNGSSRRPMMPSRLPWAAMRLSFSEHPEVGLVAVELRGADDEIVQTRLVSEDELTRIAARARAALASGDPVFVTLDELVDGTD